MCQCLSFLAVVCSLRGRASDIGQPGIGWMDMCVQVIVAEGVLVVVWVLVLVLVVVLVVEWMTVLVLVVVRMAVWVVVLVLVVVCVCNLGGKDGSGFCGHSLGGLGGMEWRGLVVCVV